MSQNNTNTVTKSPSPTLSTGSSSGGLNTSKLLSAASKADESPPTIESFEDPNKPDLFVGTEALALYEKMKEKFKDKISPAEAQLLNDCYTYIITEDPLWCVNDNHAQFLYKILHDTTGTFDKDDKLLVLQMLQLLVLSFDFVLVIKHEYTHGLMSYIQQFDKISKEEQLAVLELLCNCCYTKTGFYYLTSMIEWPEDHPITYTNGTIVSKIISDGLISKQQQESDKISAIDTRKFDLACNLVWHLSAHKLPEEMAMEISIALLQAIKTEKTDKNLFALLVGLSAFLEITPEVQGLCQVMEMKMNDYKSISTRVDLLCDEISSKLDRPLNYMTSLNSGTSRPAPAASP